MKCPICEGKIATVDVLNVDENEIYRKKKCELCGHVFFTAEFEVAENKVFKKEWQKHYRIRDNQRYLKKVRNLKNKSESQG